MAEQDTAALADRERMLRELLQVLDLDYAQPISPQAAWFRALQEVAALAQRLADAETVADYQLGAANRLLRERDAAEARATRAEEALRLVAKYQSRLLERLQDDMDLTDEEWTAFAEGLGIDPALTPTEEPPPTISHTLSGSFCDECGARLNDGTHLASCSALAAPTEEPEHG